MSFTKGFWVTIIILTLNRLQDTQRTPWAGSRAEGGGDKPPLADASPITFLSNMSLSLRPRQPDQTQQENAWAFWTAEYKNASWSCHKAHTSLWMPRAARCRREAPQSADSATSIHPGPSPHPAPTITVQSQAPKEAEIENTFSLKHSLNFMNSITPGFLSISWSEYCKTRGKGDGAGHR